MKANLAFLAGAGPEWSERLRWLANRAPSLDIFTVGFVVRDTAGWQLTIAGRKMLRQLEAPVQEIAPPILMIAKAPAEAVEVRPMVLRKLTDLHDRSRRCRRRLR
jgi:hypothetical protein